MLRKLLAFAAALPMVLSCAPFQLASAADLSPAQSQLVNGICARVMGLRNGESYYVNCQDSLTQSLARKAMAEATAGAGDTCRARGLAIGSPALSVCMLNEESARGGSAAPMQPVSLAGAQTTLQSDKDYYSVTPATRWQRERYSCAQLGLLPNSGLFGECVSSLEGEMSPDP